MIWMKIPLYAYTDFEITIDNVGRKCWTGISSVVRRSSHFLTGLINGVRDLHRNAHASLLHMKRRMDQRFNRGLLRVIFVSIQENELSQRDEGCWVPRSANFCTVKRKLKKQSSTKGSPYEDIEWWSEVVKVLEEFHGNEEAVLLFWPSLIPILRRQMY